MRGIRGEGKSDVFRFAPSITPWLPYLTGCQSGSTSLERLWVICRTLPLPSAFLM
jgi:hypothetical protein